MIRPTLIIDIAADVAAYMQSEGIQVVEGCTRDDSLAGRMLADRYSLPRFAAEAAVRGSVRLINLYYREQFNDQGSDHTGRDVRCLSRVCAG